LIPTLTPTATPVVIPYQAVVKIIAKVKSSSRLRDAWGGSGTIISPDGLILTNAHVADPLATLKADALIVAFTDDPAQTPEERYIAKVLVVDHDLDLAVLVIDTSKYFDVDRSKLNFRLCHWATQTLSS
jgi:S1-C subfamily serine protease